MSQQPTTGDHVRLTTPDFLPDYRPGDTGTVESGPHLIVSGGSYYIVTLKKDGPDATGVVCNEGEIEVDPAGVAVSGGAAL